MSNPNLIKIHVSVVQLLSGYFLSRNFECLVTRREYVLDVIGPTVFMPPLPAFCS